MYLPTIGTAKNHNKPIGQAPTAVHLYLVPAHFKPGLLDALLDDLAR